MRGELPNPREGPQKSAVKVPKTNLLSCCMTKIRSKIQTGAPAPHTDRRITRIDIPLTERAALTPREFASQFGRSQTWAYRLIYAGVIRVIKPAGAILIPCSEVNRLLNGATLYNV